MPEALTPSEQTPLSNRERLVAVAKGYHELAALQKKQRETTALMLRVCIARIKSPDSRKRKEGIDGLTGLAEMLERTGE